MRLLTFSSIISTFISIMNPLSISKTSPDEEIINNTPHKPPSIDSHNDIESANEALSGNDDLEHIQDFAKAISLGGCGASITLIVSTPSNAAAHRILYAVYIAASFIGLFAALVLAFCAAKARSSRGLAWMLKSLMFLTLTFVAIACLLRPVFALPFQYLVIEFLCIFAVIILVVVYLYIAPDCKRRGDKDVGVGGSEPS